MWQRGYWEKKSLFDLGLQVQIGHNGEECETMYSTPIILTVLHTSGFHLVRARFCDCPPALPRVNQLLRQRWYPASYVDPKTVFTFDVLEHFAELTCAGKVSAHDYYQSLVRITDASGSAHWPVRMFLL